MARIPVSVETGTKKTFASAIDWPGWSRGGRAEEGALEALVAYGPRYGAVVQRAGLDLAVPVDAGDLEVVERIAGSSGTDFGVPSQPGPSDERPIDDPELERLTAILRACWDAFDAFADGAEGVELRKGPRGGGRELDKIRDHVFGAEDAYLRQLGARHVADSTDVTAAMAGLRDAIVAALAARVRGEPIQDATRVKRPWTPRYFVRRAAWHVLDHAWEIEDRSTE